MIIDIDHVTLNARSNHDDLVSSFELAFSRDNLLNPPEKKPFLRQYFPQHSLYFYKCPKGDSAPIEITNHGGGGFLSNIPNQFQDNTLFLSVQDVSAETELLKKIGFLEKNDNKLNFKGLLLKSGLDIKLSRTDSEANYFLDDVGITCLALLSTNINSDVEKIKNSVDLISDVFVIDGPDKKLTIQICRSINGFYYEFIKVTKNEYN